jgi:hypothetical protein
MLRILFIEGKLPEQRKREHYEMERSSQMAQIRRKFFSKNVCERSVKRPLQKKVTHLVHLAIGTTGYGRGAGVGRGLGLGVTRCADVGVGVVVGVFDGVADGSDGVGEGLGGGVGVEVGVGVTVGVGVAVDVGVGVGVTDPAQYLPPVFTWWSPSNPPQTIISLPVHTAV